MSKEAADEAMEVAEAARQTNWKSPTFAGQLFMGTFDPSLLYPFPEQKVSERQEVDAYIAELQAYLKEYLDPEEVDASRTIPQEVIEKMASLGVFAMKVPKEYGGMGFSQANYNRVMMMIGSYCASTAVLVSAHQSIGVPQPLKMFGTEAQKKKFLPRFRDGAISAFALTEPGVGSDPAQMQTKATPIDGGKAYSISGEKLWCTNGPIADIIVIMATTPPKMVRGKERKQISAFILETNTPGIEVLHRCEFMGLAGIQNGLLRFNEVVVPAENLLWDEGRGLALALATLNTGRLTIPAAATGMAKQCLSIARDWGNERVQWGQAIGLHEEGRQKVSYIASSTFALEAITWLTSNWADRGDLDIRIEAAMAKLFCSETCWKIIDMTLQFRGGRGYETARSLKARGEKAYPVERMMRDSRINSIIEGTTEIMHLFLAREAMDGHMKMAMPLIRGKHSIGTKVATLGKLAKFYATWYPKRWFNSSRFTSFKEMGPLEKYFKFINRMAHKLARTMFHSMAIHRQHLEHKQLILRNLVDVGTELFAMAATCSYAMMMYEKNSSDSAPVKLADHFCALAKRRIREHFRAIRHNEDKKSNALAKSILNDEALWLEDGVVPYE